MTDHSNPTPPVELKDTGFILRSNAPLPHLGGFLRELEHSRTGARLIHLFTDDEENLFSVTFFTPPPDSTGLPHILEHSVLAGSKRYPVRDPFFEMLKMSMATFINAMTYPDHTCYPVASNVKRDLFNLAEVYFDAVFHPLLTENIFKREGHHLRPRDSDNPTGELTVNGIVYNEMKGAFSNPESALYMHSRSHLFPQTLYGREAGGDPRHIPDLRYDRFLEFYGTHYHPSRACFVVYGDIPTHEYAEFLDKRLVGFDRISYQPLIERQPRWNAPRMHEETYPVGEGELLKEKTFITMSWITGDALRVSDLLLQHILSLILLGNEAAPLKKAIVDSKLGQDLVLSGLDAYGPEMIFQVGIRGSEPERAEHFTLLVLETLRSLTAKPIPPPLVDAAFQQAAYHFQEITGGYPLQQMCRILDAALFGRPAASYLDLGAELEKIRHHYTADPDIFRRLIGETMLGNNHRLQFVLKPDPGLSARMEAEFAKRMADIGESLSSDDRKKLAMEAETLDAEQQEGNSPEALARLPQLSVGDLPEAPKEIPTEIVPLIDGAKLLYNRVFSNGINYLQVDFDLAGLNDDDIAHVSLFVDAFSKMGAAGQNYEEIARRKSACTGGIWCHAYFRTGAADQIPSMRRLRIQMKTLDRYLEPALDVLRDLLFDLDPTDEARFSDVIVQHFASTRNHLLVNGPNTASLHAARKLNREAHGTELAFGVPHLPLADAWQRNLPSSVAEISGRVTRLRDLLLEKGRLTASFTGAEQGLSMVTDRLSGWIRAMKPSRSRGAEEPFTGSEAPRLEGLAAPVEVAHCAKAMPAIHYSDEDAPLLALGAHMISNEYMLPEVRFKGNAYGAWCRYRPLERLMMLGSLNDPHIDRTLGVFAAVTDYVRKAAWTQTEIDRAIIGTAKNDEKPIRPEDATGQALSRHLSGLTSDIRRACYRRMLGATAADVRRATLAALDAASGRSSICVFASKQKLRQSASSASMAVEEYFA